MDIDRTIRRQATTNTMVIGLAVLLLAMPALAANEGTSQVTRNGGASFHALHQLEGSELNASQLSDAELQTVEGGFDFGSFFTVVFGFNPFSVNRCTLGCGSGTVTTSGGLGTATYYSTTSNTYTAADRMQK
jgi:hypothetical protein